jgi:hypothetical protein
VLVSTEPTSNKLNKCEVVFHN